MSWSNPLSYIKIGDMALGAVFASCVDLLLITIFFIAREFFSYTGLVEDYGLVNFIPLNVESKEMMLNVNE